MHTRPLDPALPTALLKELADQVAHLDPASPLAGAVYAHIGLSA